jgi:hypothetical protein
MNTNTHARTVETKKIKKKTQQTEIFLTYIQRKSVSMVVITVPSSPPPTRQIIQDAIDLAEQQGGGLVNVLNDVQSDGVSLALKSNVILDFHNKTYSFAVNSTESIDLISCSGGGLASSSSLLTQDGKQGSSMVSIAPSAASMYHIDDLVVFESQDAPYSGNLPLHWKYQVTRLVNVVEEKGELYLSEPLAFSFPVSTQSSVRALINPKRRAGLQNITLHGNGNQGAHSRCFAADGFRECNFSNIQVTGSLTASIPSDLVTGIHFKHGYNCSFQNMSSQDFASGPSVRDISFHRIGISIISNTRSLQFSGFGPNLRNATYCTFTGLISVQSQARGFRCDTSAFCVLRDIVSCGHQSVAGTGARLSFSSQRNVVNSVVTVGNGDMGFIVDAGSENNQVLGVVSAHNVIRPILFDSSSNQPSPARDNFVLGHRLGNTETETKFDPYEDISRLNTVLEVVDTTHAGGCTQQVGNGSSLPLPGRGPGHLHVSQDSDTCLRFSLTGTDGVIRHGYLSLTTT